MLPSDARDREERDTTPRVVRAVARSDAVSEATPPASCDRAAGDDDDRGQRLEAGAPEAAVGTAAARPPRTRSPVDELQPPTASGGASTPRRHVLDARRVIRAGDVEDEEHERRRRR